MVTNIDIAKISQIRPADPNRITACFTGPRPKSLHGYNDRAPYDRLVDTVSDILAELSEQNVKTFISGGAQGFDQLAFWSVRILQRIRPDSGIRNLVYVPFQKQPSRWSQYGPFGQQEYRQMLAQADQCKIIAPDPADYPATIQALNGRNHQMVADSDIVIALLTSQNMNWRTAKGGTAECVRYAHSRKKPILALKYRPENSSPIEAEWLLPN